MNTSNFVLYNCASLADVKALVGAVREASIPPGPDGSYHLWLEKDGREALLADSAFDESKSDFSPHGLVYGDQPFATLFGGSVALHVGQYPKDAFPVLAGAVGPAIEALRRSWSATASL